MRRTQPCTPGPPPRAFAILEATRGSTNRPNTTAAAGALKCRPFSFMRRVSTQRTDGCRGRSELRALRKNRGRFARARRRRKKARGPRAESEPGAVRGIHEDPRESTRRETCQSVASCMRTFRIEVFSYCCAIDRKCACEPFSTMCSYLRSM